MKIPISSRQGENFLSKQVYLTVLELLKRYQSHVPPAGTQMKNVINALNNLLKAKVVLPAVNNCCQQALFTVVYRVMFIHCLQLSTSLFH